MTAKIKKLDELVSRYLDEGEVITGYEVSLLTKPGENFGSEMLSVDFAIAENGTQRHLKTVVKLVPESEYAQKMFNTPVTFRNEAGFYETIIKHLNDFLLSKGVAEGADFAVKSYGSRTSLTANNDKVDSDAVIVLENVKSLGYKTGNKLQGYNLESTKLILTTLAKFHAAALAFKLEKPEIFEKKFKPYLWDFQEDSQYETAVTRELKKFLIEQNFPTEFVTQAVKTMERRSDPASPEPWSTIIHYDCWVNNFMIKYEGDRPKHAVLVDFQLIGYKPPTRDVVFFIFTSVEEDVLEKNVDYFLWYYFENFIEHLKRFNVDTGPFSRDAFDREVKKAAKDSEFYHIVLMLPPILEKGFVDLSYIDQNGTNDGKSFWNDKHKRRLNFVMKEFERRKWLD